MRYLSAVLLSCFAAITLLAQTPRFSPEVQSFVKVNAPVIALTHVRVVDGTGAPARQDQTIIISGGKIQQVGDAASISLPAAAPRGRLDSAATGTACVARLSRSRLRPRSQAASAAIPINVAAQAPSSVAAQRFHNLKMIPVAAAIKATPVKQAQNVRHGIQSGIKCATKSR